MNQRTMGFMFTNFHCPTCRKLFAACVCAAQVAVAYAHGFHDPDNHAKQIRHAIHQRPTANVTSGNVSVQLTGLTATFGTCSLTALKT
jgi:hypothetical protein